MTETSDGAVRRVQARDPRLALIETWRFVGPSDRVFECGIYRTDAGLQVRTGYRPDDLVRLEFAVEIGTARELAEQWQRAVIAKGSFTELGGQPDA